MTKILKKNNSFIGTHLYDTYEFSTFYQCCNSLLKIPLRFHFILYAHSHTDTFIGGVFRTLNCFVNYLGNFKSFN